MCICESLARVKAGTADGTDITYLFTFYVEVMKRSNAAFHDTGQRLGDGYLEDRVAIAIATFAWTEVENHKMYMQRLTDNVAHDGWDAFVRYMVHVLNVERTELQICKSLVRLIARQEYGRAA